MINVYLPSECWSMGTQLGVSATPVQYLGAQYSDGALHVFLAAIKRTHCPPFAASYASSRWCAWPSPCCRGPRRTQSVVAILDGGVSESDTEGSCGGALSLETCGEPAHPSAHPVNGSSTEAPVMTGQNVTKAVVRIEVRRQWPTCRVRTRWAAASTQPVIVRTLRLQHAALVLGVPKTRRWLVIWYL